jgi:hypothetical protein
MLNSHLSVLPPADYAGGFFAGGQGTARMAPKERVPEWQKIIIFAAHECSANIRTIIWIKTML